MPFRRSKKRRTRWDSGTRPSEPWCAPPTTPIARRMTLGSRKAILISLGAAAICCAAPAMAQLDRITNKEAVAGLKAALEKGSQQAVAPLGRTDGFLANPKVKIPLPDSLTRGEALMRRGGMGKYADERGVSMNRAACAAVAEERTLFGASLG